ncbi:HGGxSTG domain-containing protein [Sphingomonas sp.]|uniref:HGGxSTG domain-containing protein n=1 Tax=Sphingomonas sp. TaxID=28214 RepID=UPI0035C81834
MTNDPMHSAHQAPRCLATTRSHQQCQSPAIRGRKRCRMHGGTVGSGGQLGNSNALKHGARSLRFTRVAKLLRALKT